MGYDEMSANADKWLHADGSVTTLAGEEILPADSERADEYARREPAAAKWLLPDGSVTDALPVSGGTSGGIQGIGEAPLDDKPYVRQSGAWEAIIPYVPEPVSASEVSYDNTASGLDANNVQDAIDAVASSSQEAKAAADGAASLAQAASSEAAEARQAAEGAAAVASSALAKAPKRDFCIADVTTGDRMLTVGDCQVRLHRSGDYCQVYAASLSGKTLDWSCSQNYDGGAVQNRFGSGTAEQQIETDIGYGATANRLCANIRIENQGWRLEVSETGTANAAALGYLWASLELMEATI